MSLRTTPLAAMVSGLVAMVAALGCGGSAPDNGVAARPPAEIVSASRTAADTAHSVRVVGSILSATSPVTLDLDLAAGRGGRGRVAQGGLSFELIALAGTLYVKGSPAFYRHFGGGAAGPLLQGRWLKVPASSRTFSSLAALTDLGTLLDSTLTSHGSLSKGATTTVNGQRAVGVTDSAGGATLYVATTGRPYPVAVTRAGAGAGAIAFEHWNEPVSLAAPADAIDLAQLRSGSGL